MSLADTFVSQLPAASPPLYAFFGGKGGTGKTTCAAAAAIASAERGNRLLLVSTDPAHSLGDVLGRKLKARPTKIPVRRGSLSACELDADKALTRWLTARRPALTTILERGTVFDRGDIESFLDLAIPGVDELLGLLEVERLGDADRYDAVVVDTAPTGHTLRLLETPATFEGIARVLDLMEEKHRVLAEALGHGARRDMSDVLIDELRDDGERLGALLRDPRRVHLCWVMLPEALSVAESARAIARLRADGIPIPDVVINRVTPPPPSRCALCDGRRSVEAESLRRLPAEIAHRSTRLWTLPARDEPAQGTAALREVARSVSRLERVNMPRRRPRQLRQRRVSAPPAVVRVLAGRSSTRLLIVGGKGGVGKTTCAATLALAIARQTTDRRVLLLSTDPAHSIGDVLAQPVGDVERRVRGGPANLRAREVDAARNWQQWSDRYRASVAEMFDKLAMVPSVVLAVDREIVEELLALAPPGMDEVTGMLTMIDALWPEGDRAPFDLVIVDTAPTGHALRLLAVPAQARAWVHQLMRVILKYQSLGGFARLGGELLTLARELDRLEKLLVDPVACGFVTVMRAERLPALETIRLIDWLRRHRIPRRALVVNGLTPPGCARCRRAAARERRQVTSIIASQAWKRGGTAIIETDATASPPRGVVALERWGATWRKAGQPSTTRTL